MTWVACTWFTWEISGAWKEAIFDARVAAAELPTGAWASWLFKITITGWFTFCDSCAICADVSGACAELAAAGAAGAASAATD